MDGPSSDLGDFFIPPSRTYSELSDSNSSVGESTSSQASQEVNIDRVPSEIDLANDKWNYLNQYFIMTELPVGKYFNCSYKCQLCCKTVKVSHTSYEALKSHMKNHHNSRTADFLALIAKGVNHNKRRRESTPVSSPSAQPKIKDFRGAIWGKQTSSRVLGDLLVDLFVDAMLPIMVRKSKVKVFQNVK